MSIYMSKVTTFNHFFSSINESNITRFGGYNSFLQKVAEILKKNSNQPLSLDEIWEALKYELPELEQYQSSEKMPDDYEDRILRHTDGIPGNYSRRDKFYTSTQENPRKIKLIDSSREEYNSNKKRNRKSKEKISKAPSDISSGTSKMNFIEATKVCLKNNNNQPMSGNEIWDSIKDLVSHTGETPVATLTARLGRYSENSTHKIKSKTPIFRIVSENPNKYVLIDPDNIQETEIDDSDDLKEPTDTKISKFSDWSSSYPNVSLQYNTRTKITSEPPKFTSYLTPIDKFLDPNRPLNKPNTTDKIKNDTRRISHPFKQSICVLGEPGVGKSTTVRNLLHNAGHEFEIWEPTSTSGMLSEFSPDRSAYVPSRLGKMLILAQQNPNKIYTFVIDEAHKRETIRKIDDTLKGAISTRRWGGERFIPQELQTEYLSKFLEIDRTGNFKIPDNFSFMFISSKPDVMKSNLDIFDRLDFVVLRNWKTQNINTIDELISGKLSEDQKKEL